MHNSAFAALGLQWCYVPVRVRLSDLRKAIGALRRPPLAGANLTVPHKERALRYLDEVSPLARRCGAVNTIVRRGAKLRGENTDAPGFIRALRATRFSPRGRHALIIGAGGSARAVMVGLLDAGAREITIANRTPERARRLARHPGVSARPLGVLRDKKLLAELDLVVNCTSLGLRDERFPPFDCKATPRHCLFFDCVYGRQTDFLRRARRAGRRTADGLGMLLHQGALAFQLWTGRRPPLEVMARALRLAGRRTR